MDETRAELETQRLRISRENTKYMTFQWEEKGQVGEALRNGQPLQKVEVFKY